MKTFSKVLAISLAFAAIAVLILLHEQEIPEHQIFYNGTVLTMDGNGTVAEAVSVRGDSIEAVGLNDTILATATSSTVVHDLQGQVLLPGFIDAHGHVPGAGASAVTVDLNAPPLGEVSSIAELQQRLRAYHEANPGDGWLSGFGYDDTLMAEGRHPTREDLDAISAERPIFITHISNHMGVANSAGLAAAGISDETLNPDGGTIVRDAQGRATGLLLETASMDVQMNHAKLSFMDFLKMSKATGKEYSRYGVTTAQSGGLKSEHVTAVMIASRLKLIPQRLEIWPLWEEFGMALLNGEKARGRYETEKMRLGAIKIIVDGSIQGYTGYLSEPYATPYHGDADYQGHPNLDQDTLDAAVLDFHRKGFQLALHGNGDAAIDMIIQAVKQAQQVYPRADHRHIVIHAQMARKDQLLAMKKLGLTPSFFNAHTWYWGDRHRDIFMGPERAANMSPTGWAKEIGLPFTLHADTPVTPMRPLDLVWYALHRQTSGGDVLGRDQRIDIDTALRAVTITAAWQVGIEGRVGSIEPGKLADLVVLDRDPRFFTEELRDIEVVKTVIGGRQYYPDY